MSIRSDPVLTPVHKQGKKAKENSEEVVGDYTCVTFVPDFSKFGMTSLRGEDIVSLMKRRVYDIAGCNPTLKVSLNNVVLPKFFEEYLNMYRYDESKSRRSGTATLNPEQTPRIYVRANDRWQVGLGISHTGHFTQVSFVNSICTSKGGSHVSYIVDQVTSYILDHLKTEGKELKINASMIKVIFWFYNFCSLGISIIWMFQLIVSLKILPLTLKQRKL